MQNMADLIEKTEYHYERYREVKIVEMQMLDDKLTEQRDRHKMQENQLINTFTNKLKVKDEELKTKERSLHNTFEEMSKERIGEKMRLNAMQKQLDEDIAQLDRRRREAFNRDCDRQQTDQKLKTINKHKNLKN